MKALVICTLCLLLSGCMFYSITIESSSDCNLTFTQGDVYDSDNIDTEAKLK